jgi:hypothetical protein
MADIRQGNRKRELEILLRLLEGERLDDLSMELGIEQSCLETCRIRAISEIETSLDRLILRVALANHSSFP